MRPLAGIGKILLAVVLLLGFTTSPWAETPEQECGYSGKVMHLGKEIKLDCGSIKGVVRKSPKGAGQEQCECECPPDTALANLKEEGWKCQECYLHLMYFTWWLRDKDWERAEHALQAARPCKWQEDGQKLYRLYWKSFGD